MSFFSSRGLAWKVGGLLVLLALGPVSGLLLGDRMRIFFRGMPGSTSGRIPVPYRTVGSTDPLVLWDGFETLTVAPPERVVGRPFRVGDRVSGEMVRMPDGYRLLWARAHENRAGKHVVSLVPVFAAGAWLAFGSGRRLLGRRGQGRGDEGRQDRNGGADA